MLKLISILFICHLLFNIFVSAENADPAKHRLRPNYHQTPSISGDVQPPREDRRRIGGYPAAGFRPAHPFELPTEAQQPWHRPNGNAEQRRRPADTYGPPPVMPRKPHGSYGPPPRDDFFSPRNNENFGEAVEAESDARTDYFNDDYQEQQYPEQQQQRQFQQVAPQSGVKGANYVAVGGLQQQQKDRIDDQLENFEIPLSLLGAPSHIVTV